MSLAIYAAPFKQSPQYSQESTIKTHNKTQRSRFNTSKVQDILNKIHQSADDSDNDERDSDHEKKLFQQQQNPKEPLPNYNNNDEVHDIQSNYANEQEVKEYYKRVLPGYQESMTSVNNSSSNIAAGGGDMLTQKLNYIIHLLEEQHDEKTNNVTEENVLYMFLGVFIIFIVDSFAKVGKYVR